MERFSETEEPAVRLTPAEAEAVTRRFMEREEARRIERERLASMLTLDEVAQALGTTSEEVATLAQEVRSGDPCEEAIPPTRSTFTPPTVAREPRPNPRAIHLAYGATIIALLLILGQVMTRPSVRVTLPSHRMSTDEWFAIDPYAGVYKRKFNQGYVEPQEQLLVDPSVSAPPQGLKVSLITPDERKTIVGPTGPVKPGVGTADALRKSVQSLLKYEEGLAEIEGQPPVLRLADAPKDALSRQWQGRPEYLGWHVVEVSNGRGTYRTLLPDARYFKNDPGLANALKERLARLSDGKFIPGQPPSDLPSGARWVQAPPTLPAGLTLSLERGTQAFLAAQDSTLKPVQVPDANVLRQAITSFINDIGLTHPELLTQKGNDSSDLRLRVTYPGGETVIEDFGDVVSAQAGLNPQLTTTQEKQIGAMAEAVWRKVAGVDAQRTIQYLPSDRR